MGSVRHLRVLLAAVPLVLFLQGAFGATSAAAATVGSPCESGRPDTSHYSFDGWSQTVSGVAEGTYAEIETYNPWDGSDDVTSAWDMLWLSTSGTDDGDWGQVGYINGDVGAGGGSTPLWFYQYSDANDPSLDAWQNLYLTENSDSEPAVGTTYSYEVQYQDTSPSYMSFLIDGDDPYFIANDNLEDPEWEQLAVVSPDGWAPDTAEIEGESWNEAGQMMGDVSYHIDLADSLYETDDNWAGMDANGDASVGPTEPWYGAAQVGTNGEDLSIWDWGCPGTVEGITANTDVLHAYGGLGGANEGDDIYGGTSTSIAVASSAYQIAFANSSSELSIYDTATASTNTTGDYMEPGTSPSITALSSDSYEVAFQNTDGDLCTYSSSGTTTCTSLGMNSSSSSPSITTLSDGSFVVGFRANTNKFWTYTASGGGDDQGDGLEAATDPSVAGLTGGGWEAAFQANTGKLYVRTSGGSQTDTGLGMNTSTSPAITPLSGGSYEVALQVNTDALYSYSAGSWTDTGEGMDSDSSPAIVGLGDNAWMIAFQSNDNDLCLDSSSGQGNNDTGEGMDSDASPSIAA